MGAGRGRGRPGCRRAVSLPTRMHAVWRAAAQTRIEDGISL